jgi:RNA polymerase sigma-70 factor (ECF subfamily)
MENSDTPTDEALFQRYRRGDTGAFERLYQRHRKSLYRYLVRNSEDTAEAEDIYQEAWSRIIRAANPFSDGSFRAYLFRIARNVQIDRIRRNRLQLVTDDHAVGDHPSTGPALEEQQHLQDCSDRLLREIGQLPHEQRDAFLLKEETEMSLEQIAAVVNVGRETIKSRLRYALQRLRAALEDCL